MSAWHSEGPNSPSLHMLKAYGRGSTCLDFLELSSQCHARQRAAHRQRGRLGDRAGRHLVKAETRRTWHLLFPSGAGASYLLLLLTRKDELPARQVQILIATILRGRLARESGAAAFARDLHEPPQHDTARLGRSAASGDTFCCAMTKSASPRTLREVRQSRDSFVSLSSTISTVSSTQIASPLPQGLRMQGWMYWARNEDSKDDTSAQRYTKVYAVLRNEFLLLYRNDQRPSKNVRAQPLVQIAVATSWRGVDGVLHVEDPYGETMELHLYEREDYETSRMWGDALEQASELTHAHFSHFDVKVEDLSRGSVYRGTLHDFRLDRESSIRRSVTHMKKFKTWNSLRKFIPTRISSRMKYSRSSAPS